jgi:hypothetical protein
MTLRNSSACAMTVRSRMDYSTYVSYLMQQCSESLRLDGVSGRKSAAENFYEPEEWALIQRLKKPPVTMGVDFAWEKTLRKQTGLKVDRVWMNQADWDDIVKWGAADMVTLPTTR